VPVDDAVDPCPIDRVEVLVVHAEGRRLVRRQAGERIVRRHDDRIDLAVLKSSKRLALVRGHIDEVERPEKVVAVRLHIRGHGGGVGQDEHRLEGLPPAGEAESEEQEQQKRPDDQREQ
jgi:hypothetical protein